MEPLGGLWGVLGRPLEVSWGDCGVSRGALGGPLEPWGVPEGSQRGAGGSLGYLGDAPGGTLGSLGGSWGGPMGEFKGSWQLWKPLKNHWFLLCFETLEAPGGALEGPWGLAWDLGASPRPSGRLLRDRFGVLEGSESSK